MKLVLINNGYEYELQKLCMLFLPYEKIAVVPMEDVEEGEDCAVARVCGADLSELYASVRLGGRFAERAGSVGADESEENDDTAERGIAILLFECFCELTGRRPPWGILTGVRPAKLMGRLADKLGESRAVEYFTGKLSVSPRKAALCAATYRSEREIIALSGENSASLYVSIPFCPTRCAYCSFVSHSVERAGRLIDDYIDLLCRELAATGETARALGLKIETVYIGGGTPTVLSPEQLKRVIGAAADSFDFGSVREYTVEAGRPDTVTAEKLEAVKLGGADRICINPQTMNDRVLEAIGRRHTAKQTVEAFALARAAGFENINMDLIAGLPLDTPESFEDTVRRILTLDPDEVTVHSLAMKRASRLTGEDYRAEDHADRMIDYADSALPAHGFAPYYLYRQSKTVGNLENVGFAKWGKEGLYNVFIMDETHTILACGASAVTKMRRYGTNEIERIFNFKYPYEYISRFDEILARKQKIEEFYRK